MFVNHILKKGMRYLQKKKIICGICTADAKINTGYRTTGYAKELQVVNIIEPI